jgi:type II secretory pathway component GspD/PulD (secretin)
MASAQSVSTPINAQATGLPQPASEIIAVDYRNGLLSVVTDKAELGKVLQLVGSKIGTPIEVAPEVAADPVVAHIRPAPPTQVLAQLLDGPQLEYIVIGSDDSGQVLNRVVVRRRSSFARQPLVAIKRATQAPEAAK